MDVVTKEPAVVVPRKGRPPKSELAKKKPGGRGGVKGRPPGEASRLAEFKARLLGTTGEKIIETLIRKAMNDEDKDQFAALKFCAERILPMSAFDAAKTGNQQPQISINITGLSDVKMASNEGDIIDV